METNKDTFYPETNTSSFLFLCEIFHPMQKKKVTNFSQIWPAQNNTITLNYHKPKKP